jgi:hypothetical protein
MISLYHNEGNGLFVDEAPRSEVGRKSLLSLGFGCFFFDYDNDGWLDILVANGHIESEIEKIQKRVSYAEPPHLFRNVGKGKFEEVTEKSGTAFAAPRVARGAAYGDIDNDGAPDVLFTTNGGPVYLFHNEGSKNHSIRFKLVGTKSNRDGIGSVVRVTVAGETQAQTLRSGSTYLSQDELIVTAGLGQHQKAEAIEIRWPSGEVERLASVAADQMVTVQEGKGIVRTRPYGKAPTSKKAKP